MIEKLKVELQHPVAEWSTRKWFVCLYLIGHGSTLTDDVKMWMSWYSWARGLSLSVPRYIATLTKFQRATRLLLVQPNRQNQCWKCPKDSVKETLSFSPWRKLETVLCLRKVAGFHRHKYSWKCPHKVELRSLAWQRCCFVIIWLEGQTNRGQAKHHIQTAL